MSPLVSVIVPTYGRAAFLEEAVRSVAVQTYEHVECIVVDDCSPQPINLPQDLMSAKVRLVRHETNRGPGGSRNTGIALARGELVTFLDDDDLFTRDRIGIAVRGIGTRKMHSMAADVNGSVIGRKFEGDMSKTIMRAAPPLMGQSVFRRSIVREFDPSLRVTEDIEWWIRMRADAVFAWDPTPGVIVRRNDADRPGVDAKVRFECRREVLARHRAELSSDRKSLAELTRRVAAGALLAGDRRAAVEFGLTALRLSPRRKDLVFFARALRLGGASN